MKIKVPSGRETPEYSNFTVIDSKFGEILFHFCFSEGDETDLGFVVRKLAMHPRNARNFCSALSTALKEYEERYGPIDHQAN